MSGQRVIPCSVLPGVEGMDVQVETADVVIEGDDTCSKVTKVDTTKPKEKEDVSAVERESQGDNVGGRSSPELSYPLEISYEDALVSLKFDDIVLRVAFIRYLVTIYFCFCVGSLIGSEKPTQQMFTQSTAMTNALAPSIWDSSATTPFREIDNIDDVYSWLTETFIPTVFVTTDYNGTALAMDQRGLIASKNQVLGGVIVEITQVIPMVCDNTEAFVRLYPICGGMYSGTASSTFLEIGLSSAEAITKISDLRANDTWINHYTEQVLVTVAAYNGEVDGFSITRLQMDFRQSGTIELKALTKAIPDYREQDLAFVYTLGAIFIALGIWLIILEQAVAPPARLGRSIWSKANDLFWFCMKFGAIPIYFGLLIKALKTNVDEELVVLADCLDSSQSTFSALVDLIEVLDSNVSWMVALSVSGAATVFQLCLFFLRQLRFHPRLNIFARTVMNSLRQFVDFALIFVIIFLTFSFIGNSLFGKQVLQFSMASTSMESCMNMLFGEFDYSSIRSINGSGVFYWSYMVVVSLILLNMMLAIVMGSYKNMSKEGYNGVGSRLLFSRLRHDPLPDELRDWFRPRVKLGRALLSKKHAARTRPSEDDKEAANEFDELTYDVRKLNNVDLIDNGRVRTGFLYEVLALRVKRQKKVFGTKVDGVDDQSNALLTPDVLKQMFPGAELSDEEIRATFNYLHEGLRLTEAVRKPSKMANIVLEKSSEAREREKQKERRRSIAASQQLVNPEASDDPALKLAALERKIDVLVAEVIALRKEVRHPAPRDVEAE